MSENELYDAATRGDEKSLEELLEQYPHLLHRVSYTCSNKTPLHVATIHGHLPFVQAILNRNPDLAQELDSHESSALHVASFKGYLEISRELLSAARDMCLSLDHRGRTPLHLAAMKGHVEVLAELVRVAPSAAGVKLDRGMTVLHLCVEYGQLEALKILVDNMNELVNAKNDDGDTVLHVAVRERKFEIVKFLLTVSALEVNALNLIGLTPTNMLGQGRPDARDSEIVEALRRAGGFLTLETNLVPPRAPMLLERQKSWLENKKNALMVVASLLATMTFQVGLNPPIKIWEEDKIDNSVVAGFYFLMIQCKIGYAEFYIINTATFIASLSIILLLISGLPFRSRFFMWILIVITWTAITTAAVAYMASIILLAPYVEHMDSVSGTLVAFVFVWFGLVALLLIGHTVRLVVKVVKKLRQKPRVDAFVEREN